MADLRINRALAATGYCSRRAADRLIEEGRVKVNGKPVTDFNLAVDPERDVIAVDDQELSSRDHVYVAFHKPRGVITTMKDEKGRQTVLDLLPGELQHLKPVGRLDRDSEGLLILTNDGDFAHRLAHPSRTRHVWKTYRVRVDGRLSDEAVTALEEGVLLSEGDGKAITLPARVTNISYDKECTVFSISIREGRNRQIRRMCAKLGYPVIRLVRVAIGRLQLKPMEPGEWKYLTRSDLDRLTDPGR
ncbi:MAG: rRNA pseudouridine synthase [Candidatus Melainabacteria bacterium]|nr:rRNA pseudouridine synthase [Candidatus Melainabacteria bacterium]